MGGFTNLIYFKNYLTDSKKDRIKNELLSCGSSTPLVDELSYDIVVENGGQEHGFRIYYSDAEDDGDFDTEDRGEFQKKLGYIPKCYLGFMAWTNLKFGQVFIAELMSKVLEIQDGIIDFSAAIDPQFTNSREKIREFVSQIHGTIVESDYKTDSGSWFTHLANKEFLDNWRCHEKFYIPK